MSKIPPNNKLDLAEKAFHIRFCPFHNELADLVSARELGGFSWFLLWEQAPQPELDATLGNKGKIPTDEEDKTGQKSVPL
jgi:hypothetical protein